MVGERGRGVVEKMGVVDEEDERATFTAGDYRFRHPLEHLDPVEPRTQLRQQRGEGAERHPCAGLRGGHPHDGEAAGNGALHQLSGQPRLADAGRPGEHDAAFLLEPVRQRLEFPVAPDQRPHFPHAVRIPVTARKRSGHHSRPPGGTDDSLGRMLPAVLSPLSWTALSARHADGAVAPSPTDLDESRQAVSALRAERPVLSRLSSRQLFERAATIIDHWAAPLLSDHAAVTAAALESAARVGSRCADLGDPTAALRLLAPLGGPGGLGVSPSRLESAEASWALWRLGRFVAGSLELTLAFDQGPDDVHLRLLGAAGDGALFLDRLDAFLHDFGSFGPNDWDLTSPTWETHPDLALVAIDRMRLVPDELSPAVRHAGLIADRRAGIRHVIDDAGKLGPVRRDEFEAALDHAGRLLAARDRSKTTFVRMLHEARMSCYEIGRRMVEQGYLDRVADFGMVTFDEFPAFLDDPESFALTVRERRAELEARSSRGPAPGGAPLAGAPGSPGVATGPVRIVTNPADPGPLQPGDIAASPAADPASLPLFLPAGAVIVEAGDWLQHAVVACRELGIPAVCACEGATTRLTDGLVVTVDGAAGTVTIHETATV